VSIIRAARQRRHLVSGAGLNTSPKTTSIVSPPTLSYSETSLNYSFAPVTAVNNPGASSFDLNADGRTDQFLTFYVPFSAIVSALATEGITFSLNSPCDCGRHRHAGQ